MSVLVDFVLKNTQRGSCQCGRCIDADPDVGPIEGHTVSVEFFEVGLAEGVEIGSEEFRKLVSEHSGEFSNVDPFDGEEHGFIELGGWIGDRALALQAMALGDILGVWRLRTPSNMLPAGMSDELRMSIAQSGMVTIIATEGEDPDLQPGLDKTD